MQEKLKNIFSRVLPSFALEERLGKRTDGDVKLYGKNYSVVRWDAAKYEEALRDVIRLYPKNGPGYVETNFSNALARVLIKLSLPDEAVATMHVDLVNNVKKRFICIPIQGIDLRLKEVAFGFGKLLNREQGVLPQIINDYESLSSYQHRINALNECLCYFEFEAETDHRHSIDSAVTFANYLTSLLSLYVGSTRYRTDYQCHPWHKRELGAKVGRKRKIAIYGSEPGSPQVYYEYYDNDSRLSQSKYLLEFKLLLSGHDSNECLNQCLEFLRPEEAKTSYHLLNDAAIDKMLSADNERLLTCVLRNSPLDKKIFNAVSWFGKAVNCDNNEDQFLFFAIAIECLLVGDEISSEFSSQGSISQKISERAAYLSAEMFEQRLQIERETKRLYGIRSKIVHAGADVESDEVLRIEKLAKKLIFEFSKKKFESQDAFLKWIKICQYGGVNSV